MTDITNQAQVHGVIWNACATAAHFARAGIAAVNRNLALRRAEAILRTLDSRLLEDIGFEPVAKNEIVVDHVCRNEFAPLRDPFSWTRFGK